MTFVEQKRNALKEDWFDDDDEEDEEDYPFDDEEDYMSDVPLSDEEHEERPEVFKPRIIKQLAIPKQDQVVKETKEEVVLPLHWCDDERPHEESIFSAIVEEEERVWKKQRRRRRTSLKRVNELTSRSCPRIRVIVNERPKCNEFNDRQQNGYGPYEIKVVHPHAGKMCPHLLNKTLCRAEKCPYEHSLEKWCKMDRQDKMCYIRQCHLIHQHHPTIGKMCNSVIQKKACFSTLCRFEHALEKWCKMDQQEKVCTLRQCSLVHHHNPKRPVRMLMCPRGKHCRAQKCFMAHTEEEQFANAQPCKNDDRCTAKKCFRLHSSDTQESLVARLKM